MEDVHPISGIPIVCRYIIIVVVANLRSTTIHNILSHISAYIHEPTHTHVYSCDVLCRS